MECGSKIHVTGKSAALVAAGIGSLIPLRNQWSLKDAAAHAPVFTMETQLTFAFGGRKNLHSPIKIGEKAQIAFRLCDVWQKQSFFFFLTLRFQNFN